MSIKRKSLNILILVFIFFVEALTLNAQEQPPRMEGDLPSEINNKANKDNPFGINAEVGYMKFAEVDYIGLRISPDISFLKFGIGLDIPVMFNINTWDLYTNEFNGGVGALRLISYARWGIKKSDPVFIKFGELSNVNLGYGILINNYSNSISYDQRKFGLSFDILIKKVIGIEGIYSDFNFVSLNLLGIRPYIKPFGATKIKILKNLDIGLSYVTDHDNTYKPLSTNDYERNMFVKEGIHAFAGDIGIHLINKPAFNFKIFAQYGGLLKSDTLKKLYQKQLASYPGLLTESTLSDYNNGQGQSVGSEFRINIGKLFITNIRIERLFNSDHFIPQFFDEIYEINKDAKMYNLGYSKKCQGIYSSLTLNFIGRIYAKGSLLMPDNLDTDFPALLKIDLDASGLTKHISITGSYIKGNITNMNNAFILDNYSLINATVNYKFNPWLLVGVKYQRTYSINEDEIFLPVELYFLYFGLNFKF